MSQTRKRKSSCGAEGAGQTRPATMSVHLVLFQARFASAQQIKDYLTGNPRALDLLRRRKIWTFAERNPLLELANICSFQGGSSKAGVGMLTEETVLEMMQLLVEQFKVNLEATDTCDGRVFEDKQAESIDLRIIHAHDPEPPKEKGFTPFHSYVCHDSAHISSTLVIVDFFLRNGANLEECADAARLHKRYTVARRITQFEKGEKNVDYSPIRSLNEKGKNVASSPIRSLNARLLGKLNLKRSLKKAKAVSDNMKNCLEEFAEQDRLHRLKLKKLEQEHVTKMEQHQRAMANLKGGADYRSPGQQMKMKGELLKMDSELKDMEELCKTLRQLEEDEDSD